VTYFSAHRDRLDDDSRRRLETNPLRILDSKNPDVIAVAAGAPKLIDELGEGSRARFARVRSLLDALGVKHAIDPGLVRGLDYYTGTIFEIKTKAGELGSQNTVAAAAATIASSRRWAARARPRSASRWASSARCSQSPSQRESYEPALAVFFAPMDAAALDSRCRSSTVCARQGIRIEIEHRPARPARCWRARASCARAPP
jgi:hypothetical protein